MKVSEMPAGQAMNLLVAEKVMGWTWIQPPQWDYNGPLPEQGLILAPPGFEDQMLRTGWRWPPKGVIPANFLLNINYSFIIGDAWEVVQKMTRGDKVVRINTDSGRTMCRIISAAGDGIASDLAESAPLAICRAALHAVGVL